MILKKLTPIALQSVVLTALLSACAAPVTTEDESEQLGSLPSALTAQQRLTACAQDPRVKAGLVSVQVCAGAGIFFEETFGGNGRTCGSCHPAGNNTTIDVAFVTTLHDTNPADPLFVFETDPNLANLEVPSAMFGNATILENVDGFEDPANKFVVRSVPHVLSLKTTIARDNADPLATNPPVERTGWGGDGSPGDGSLRSFLTGAVTQHYPKTLARMPGVDFRLPTAQELDLTSTFQLALGRLNELDLNQVNIFDPVANQGRAAFMDPQRGRCNVCHANAGANFQDTGRNRNFDTMTRIATAGPIGNFANLPFFDAGFGGQGLTQPNFDPLQLGFNSGLGNGGFNTPSLIEAPDTAPFFHNNAFGSEIEDAVFFYVSVFTPSPAAADLVARFGTPINFSTEDGFAIARFLRVLNVAFNLDIAKQRLNAAKVLAGQFHDSGAPIQRKLLELAVSEIDDVLFILSTNRQAQPFLPVAVERLGLAKQEIALALAPGATWQTRQSRASNAHSRVLNARDQTGANINFQMGQGNLMF